MSADAAPTSDRRRSLRRRSGARSLDPHERRRAFLLISPAMAVLAVVIGYPVCRAVYMSFQNDPHLDSAGFFVPGGFAGFQNFTHWLFQRCGGASCPPGNPGSAFWNVVGITIFFTVVSVAIELVLGFWFATIMNGSYRGRSLVRAAVLVPWAIPTAVTAKLWYFIFSYEGIANRVLHAHVIWFGDAWAARTAIIVSDVWKTTPFMALLILAGLQMIPSDVYEAARVDGATRWQQFWAITVPLARPAIVVALLFRTLDVLRMFDLPYIMTGGGTGSGHATTTLSILVVNQVRNGFNSAAALSTLTFVFIFVVAFVFVKFLGANATGAEEETR
ncbi:sugar ABC transporter permease [Nocardioides maradonensis]